MFAAIQYRSFLSLGSHLSTLSARAKASRYRPHCRPSLQRGENDCRHPTVNWEPGTLYACSRVLFGQPIASTFAPSGWGAIAASGGVTSSIGGHTIEGRMSNPCAKAWWRYCIRAILASIREKKYGSLLHSIRLFDYLRLGRAFLGVYL